MLRRFIIYVQKHLYKKSAKEIREEYIRINPDQDISLLRDLSAKLELLEEDNGEIKTVHLYRTTAVYKLTLRGHKISKRFGGFWLWVDDNDKRVSIVLGFISGVIIGSAGLAVAIVG